VTNQQTRTLTQEIFFGSVHHVHIREEVSCSILTRVNGGLPLPAASMVGQKLLPVRRVGQPRRLEGVDGVEDLILLPTGLRVAALLRAK